MNDQLQQWSVKYRPKTLNDLIIAEAQRAQVQDIFDRPERAHALLIAGPSGGGKTTCARLIATSITNNTPEDISERNIGDERGIDAMREMVSMSRYLPSNPKPKARRVFILDEVHALTGASASTLLKALEEPYPHVMWILCTDQPERLLPSVVNRCMTIPIRYPSADAMKALLLRVLKRENELQDLPVKDRVRLVRAVGEASEYVPRAALQLLQTAVGARGKFKTVKELIANAVVGASPTSDANKAISKIILGLLLSGKRDTIKPVLAAVSEQEGFTFLNRLLKTTTAVLLEVATGVRQNGAYFTIEAAGKLGVDLDMDRLAIIHGALAEAQARSTSFTVDARALLINACFEARNRIVALKVKS